MALIKKIKKFLEIINKINNIDNNINNNTNIINHIENLILNKDQIDKNRFESLINLLGQLHVERIKQIKNISSLKDVEFKIYSQFGVDGIIQYLINNIEIPNKYFIEFGVENYLESNTRFLLVNNNWEGLIFDGSESNIDFIKNDRLSYRHYLTSECQFVTKDNINDIIKNKVNIEDIGLVSIDIDGNDYWIWNELVVVKPRVVICEYNNLFGSEHSITIPYDPNFSVIKAHYSCLFYGSSLPALCNLAEKKGYDFVGCDSEGVDAFFVRKDISAPFKKYSAIDGFVKGTFRISRNIQGQLTYLNRQESLNMIKDLTVYDLKTRKLVNIESLNIK